MVSVMKQVGSGTDVGYVPMTDMSLADAAAMFGLTPAQCQALWRAALIINGQGSNRESVYRLSWHA